MNKKILTNKIWMSVLTILITFSLGLSGQADAKSYKLRNVQTVETVAKASAYVGTAPLQVQFNAGSSIVTEGSIETCKWKFGRGQIQEGMIINHTFDDPGHYVVRLLVKNTLEAYDRDSIYIEVTSRQIYVDDMTIDLVQEESGAFKAQVNVVVTDNDGTPVPDVMIVGKWRGLVHDNVTGITDADGKAVFVSESSDKEGIFRFKVSSAGVAGCRFIQGRNSIRISTDEFANLPPEVNLAADRLCGPAPFTVTFCGQNCFDPDGEIIDFEWDFGDGCQGCGCTCGHVYSEIGTYNTRLTITDDHNQESSGEMMIIVTGAPE